MSFWGGSAEVGRPPGRRGRASSGWGRAKRVVAGGKDELKGSFFFFFFFFFLGCREEDENGWGEDENGRGVGWGLSFLGFLVWGGRGWGGVGGLRG